MGARVDEDTASPYQSQQILLIVTPVALGSPICEIRAVDFDTQWHTVSTLLPCMRRQQIRIDLPPVSVPTGEDRCGRSPVSPSLALPHPSRAGAPNGADLPLPNSPEIVTRTEPAPILPRYSHAAVLEVITRHKSIGHVAAGREYDLVLANITSRAGGQTRGAIWPVLSPSDTRRSALPQALAAYNVTGKVGPTKCLSLRLGQRQRPRNEGYSLLTRSYPRPQRDCLRFAPRRRIGSLKLAASIILIRGRVIYLSTICCQGLREEGG